LFNADPSPVVSNPSPGFKLGGMIKICSEDNSSSEETEPVHPHIIMADS